MRTMALDSLFLFPDMSSYLLISNNYLRDLIDTIREYPRSALPYGNNPHGSTVIILGHFFVKKFFKSLSIGPNFKRRYWALSCSSSIKEHGKPRSQQIFWIRRFRDEILKGFSQLGISIWWSFRFLIQVIRKHIRTLKNNRKWKINRKS
jgi:hypothetical protein